MPANNRPTSQSIRCNPELKHRATTRNTQNGVARLHGIPGYGDRMEKRTSFMGFKTKVTEEKVLPGINKT